MNDQYRTESGREEMAYRIMVACLPASWIEKSGSNVMTPKAIKLRGQMSNAMRFAYECGQRDARKESL